MTKKLRMVKCNCKCGCTRRGNGETCECFPESLTCPFCEIGQHLTHFTTTKTAQGYLLQCVEIPEIILEVAKEEDVEKTIMSALDCYYKSFPNKPMGLKEKK